MLRLFQKTVIALTVAGAVSSAPAFSLLGPYAADASGAVWQTVRIGYNQTSFGLQDIGGPMNLGEEYRWNVRTLVYAFDPSFVNYFGQKGVDEINKAIAILNNLPAVSKMSTTLSEFPLDAKQINYRASAANLLDLKSFALGMLVEEMGLASAERYVWCLRARLTPVGATNYAVIMRNFDPVTLVPTPYVNGALYTYTVYDTFLANPDVAVALVQTVDPLSTAFTAVAATRDGLFADPGPAGAHDWPSVNGSLQAGQFWTGLTRDDIGGLRYIYSKLNYNNENLLTNVTSAGSQGAWSVPGVAASNAIVVTAVRGGVDKIVFKQGQFNSYFGSFITITNLYSDNYVTNRRSMSQRVQRVLVQPDILFAAGDLGTYIDAALPITTTRTTTAGWANNFALNTASGETMAGPGVIQPMVILTFNNVGPMIYDSWPSFLTQANPLTTGFVWGSFDGTTNAPFVYPQGSTIQQLEQMVLGAPQP